MLHYPKRAHKPLTAIMCEVFNFITINYSEFFYEKKDTKEETDKERRNEEKE
jgi:hypothetical protein